VERDRRDHRRPRLAGRQANPQLRQALTASSVVNGAARVGYHVAFVAASNADQVYSVSQFKDKYDVIADLHKKALACNNGDSSAAYQKRVETMLQQALRWTSSRRPGRRPAWPSRRPPSGSAPWWSGA
jgi:hypothetical protein